MCLLQEHPDLPDPCGCPLPPVHLVTAPAGTQSHHKALPTCWHTNELMFPYSRSVPLSLFLLNTFENINLSSEKKNQLIKKTVSTV